MALVKCTRFFKLRLKRLHPSLLKQVDSESLSLLDWVSLEEVSQMQKEAFNEMAEMQVGAYCVLRRCDGSLLCELSRASCWLSCSVSDVPEISRVSAQNDEAADYQVRLYIAHVYPHYSNLQRYGTVTLLADFGDFTEYHKTASKNAQSVGEAYEVVKAILVDLTSHSDRVHYFEGQCARYFITELVVLISLGATIARKNSFSLRSTPANSKAFCTPCK